MAQSKTVVCTAALVALVAVGCGDQSRSSEPLTTERTETNEANENATGTAGEAYATGTTRVADIVSEPNSYFGREVTVVADVEEVLGPMAFALDEDAPLQGGIDRDLLVFSPKSGNLADIDDQWLQNKVKVTGKVGHFTVTEIEREIGWDLDPQIEIELERAGAMLIASSIERVDDAARR